jgi:hypothetical protein
MPPVFALMQKPVAPKKIKALRRIRLSAFFSVLQGFAHPTYAIVPQDSDFILRLLRAGAWPLPPGQITANQKKSSLCNNSTNLVEGVKLNKGKGGLGLSVRQVPMVSKRLRWIAKPQWFFGFFFAIKKESPARQAQ